MADTTITRIGPNGIAVPEKMHDNGDGTYSSGVSGTLTATGSFTALAGEAHIGKVGGEAALASAAQFTRPTDTNSYAVGDLVANNTAAGSVTPLSFTVARVAAGSGMLRRARIRKSGTSISNASFRLHLYKASPTPSNGDNGAWLTNQALNYLGSFDITMDKAFTDGASGNGLPTIGSEVNFVLASGQVIYGLLEARAAYTPANAETFDVALEVLQN